MSKVQLAGNASGTGIFQIASPNSNTDRTLTLPDATGTVQVSGNPISGTTGTFTGLLDISASGAGQIQFPAAQNASSNANTLDDYEEGTWTPTIIGSGGSAGSQSYATQAGRYTKIGNMVILTGYVALGVKGSWTGNVRVGGFPFTVLNSPGAYGGTMFFGSAITLPAGGSGCGAYPEPNTTFSQVIYSTSVGTSALTDYAAQINNNSQIGAFTIVYPTNT